MTATFNPAEQLGLERVSCVEELRNGDEILVSYHREEGDVDTTTRFEIHGSPEGYAHLFGDPRRVHFLAKVERLTLKPGTFGVAITKDGGEMRGYVDMDGEFFEIRGDGHGGTYYTAGELSDFHEVKLELPVLAQAEPEVKYEGLIPGRDKLPEDVRVFIDRDGDLWCRTFSEARQNGTAHAFEFSGGSWDDPRDHVKMYAPYRAARVPASDLGAAPTKKLSGLEPGVDPEPDRELTLLDKQGDKWKFDTEAGEWVWMLSPDTMATTTRGGWSENNRRLLEFAPFQVKA